MVVTIFCPSIISTGSNFLCEFFSAHPSLESVDPNTRKVRLEQALEGKSVSEFNIVKTHFEYYSGKQEVIRDFALKSNHVAIAIRDPLASLLKGLYAPSCKYNVGLRVQAYLDAISLGELCKVHYIPVDLLASATTNERLRSLVEVSGSLIPESICMEWAENWPTINSAGEYSLKSLHRSGNIDELQLRIPGQIWRDLHQAIPTVRPFLEGLGYRELLWWT